MKKSFKSTFLHILPVLPLAALCLHGQAASAGTSSTSGKYEGQTLCDAGDEIFAACPTKSRKIVSICGTTKRKPSLMYLVYGTPDKIEVSSPRTGEFPLKRSHIDTSGNAWYFSENGKYYIQYTIEDVGQSEPFDREGFIILNGSDHKVMALDLCKESFKLTEKTPNSYDYEYRQEKSPSYNYDIDGYRDELFDLMFDSVIKDK